MQSLREFFTSSSGLVPARQGLGFGVVISALTVIAILLGAKEAKPSATEEGGKGISGTTQVATVRTNGGSSEDVSELLDGLELQDKVRGELLLCLKYLRRP